MCIVVPEAVNLDIFSDRKDKDRIREGQRIEKLRTQRMSCSIYIPQEGVKKWLQYKYPNNCPENKTFFFLKHL